MADETKTEVETQPEIVKVRTNPEKMLPGASFTHPSVMVTSKKTGDHKLTIGSEPVDVEMDEFITEKLYVTKELILVK